MASNGSATRWIDGVNLAHNVNADLGHGDTIHLNGQIFLINMEAHRKCLINMGIDMLLYMKDFE